MKTAIYPGSFNPWHQGHSNVVTAALLVFDHVIIARGNNSEKASSGVPDNFSLNQGYVWANRVSFKPFNGLFADFMRKLSNEGIEVNAVLKGLRNSQDFEYEKAQMYHNEDLGVCTPTFYVIADRLVTHISSSAVRAIEKAKGDK